MQNTKTKPDSTKNRALFLSESNLLLQDSAVRIWLQLLEEVVTTDK